MCWVLCKYLAICSQTLWGRWIYSCFPGKEKKHLVKVTLDISSSARNIAEVSYIQRHHHFLLYKHTKSLLSTGHWQNLLCISVLEGLTSYTETIWASKGFAFMMDDEEKVYWHCWLKKKKQVFEFLSASQYIRYQTKGKEWIKHLWMPWAPPLTATPSVNKAHGGKMTLLQNAGTKHCQILLCSSNRAWNDCFRKIFPLIYILFVSKNSAKGLCYQVPFRQLTWL